jgi:hypothetical protein
MALAKEQIAESLISDAILLTALKSPFEAAAKPA